MERIRAHGGRITAIERMLVDLETHAPAGAMGAVAERLRRLQNEKQEEEALLEALVMGNFAKAEKIHGRR
jgi:hypothetical protein